MKKSSDTGAKNVMRFGRSEFHFFSGLNHLFRAYYECIRDDGAPPIPYRDILRVSAMLDDIFEQVKKQQGGGGR